MSDVHVIDDVQQDVTNEPAAPQDPIERKLREILGDDEEPAQASGSAADEAGEMQEPADGKSDAPATDDAAEATFTPRHLNAAQRFGLTQEDLAALGDRGLEVAERLAKAHSDIGRRYSDIGRAQQRLAAAGSQEPACAEGSRTGAGSQEEQGGSDSEAASAAGEGAGLKGELDQLRRQVGDLVRQVQRGHLSQQETLADQFFAQLDSEVYPQFGRDSLAALAADDPQRASRRQLLGKAREIAHGYELVHGEPMEFQQSLRQALAIVAADAPLAAQRRRLAQAVSQRSGQRIERPTQRSSGRSLESPLERTRSALDEWEKTRGVRFFND